MGASPAVDPARPGPFREPFGRLVPGGSAVSVPGVRVGAAQAVTDGWLTGTTVLLPPAGTVTGVDVRGGGPAGHETDVLAPGTHSPGADAVVLTGGSAWGLSAALGVQQGLAADGRGFPAPQLPGAHVPIVPTAAVYDLGRGDGTLKHPGPEMGLAAYRSARDEGGDRAGVLGGRAPVRGSVGGGTGAFTGRGLLRGGLGSVCLRTRGGHLVAALVVANPMGGVLAPSGRPHADSVLERVGLAVPPAPADWLERALALDGTARDAVLSPGNTTIAAIVTDARLDAAQTTRVAQSAQAGLARAIHPSHTLYDGDTVFALATGGAQPAPDPQELTAINAAAADALSLAIVDAVAAAAAHPRGAHAPAGRDAGTAPESGAAAPRPAALREVAPDLVDAWEALTTAS